MTAPPSFPFASLLVLAGGAVGSWLRFAANWGMVALVGPVAAGAFPMATLFVNIVGSLAMGVLAGWLARQGGVVGGGGDTARLLLGTGVLGGFTTFSTFSLDFAVLVERGTPGLAMVYVALSLAAGFGGLFLGLGLARAFG